MANAAPNVQAPYEIVCDSHDRASWLEARRAGIGASEMAALLGHTKWSSPLSLYAQKIGAVPQEDKDLEFITWGQLLEPVIANEFSRRTKRHIEKGGKLLRSTRYPWALCTLDYWTFGEGVILRPLEIKNASEWKAEDWADGPPPEYVIQAHQQMLVTDTQHNTVACLLGGNRLAWCDVDRDERLIRKIVYHGDLFWQRVQQRTPPDPDGSDATRAVLRALFPEDNGSTVELPMVLAEKVDEWRVLKGTMSETKKQVDRLEAEIKATLGPAQVGVFPGGDQVSWKTEHVAEHVVKAHSKRVLRYHPSKLSKGR